VLLVWLKLLYFLRIFSATSSLIRMIVQVVFDIRYFLFILFLTVCAFGDAYGVISAGNPPTVDTDYGQFVDYESYIGGILYVYRMTLGDFSTSKFGKVNTFLSWCLFMTCSIFNMIIMLNLLISIIAESYSRISENIDAAAEQEKASMVAENSFMIPNKRKQSFCPKNKYLVVATDISEDVDESQANINVMVESLKKQVSKQIVQTNKNVEGVAKSVK
jgi:hypothetical protein